MKINNNNIRGIIAYSGDEANPVNAGDDNDNQLNAALQVPHTVQRNTQSVVTQLREFSVVLDRLPIQG